MRQKSRYQILQDELQLPVVVERIADVVITIATVFTLVVSITGIVSLIATGSMVLLLSGSARWWAKFRIKEANAKYKQNKWPK